MSRPAFIFVEYRGKRVTLRELAKATGHRYNTITQRQYVQKLRGPELWAPSKRPRMHVA